jgi:transposase
LKTYSHDLRERVVRACDDGTHSHQYLAELFSVSTAWIRRLLQRRRETGSFAAKPRGGGPATKMTDERCGRLLVLVAEQPDATLAELHQRLDAPVHRSTIARALTRLGWTVKKKSCGRPSRTVPTSARNAPAGAAGRAASTPTASSSSMKWGRTRP